MQKLAFLFISTLTLATAAAAAPDRLRQGRELFNSPRLGSNGKSCGSCHPGAENLGETASYDDVELVKAINQCVKEGLVAKPPASRSPEMAALIAYIRGTVRP